MRVARFAVGEPCLANEHARAMCLDVARVADCIFDEDIDGPGEDEVEARRRHTYVYPSAQYGNARPQSISRRASALCFRRMLCYAVSVEHIAVPNLQLLTPRCKRPTR